jgi:hypothetical protein
MVYLIGFIILVVIAVLLLKGFDKIAGRGPQQVKDGINQSRIGQSEPSRTPCPYCAEMILPAAKKCPFCKSELSENEKS